MDMPGRGVGRRLAALAAVLGSAIACGAGAQTATAEPAQVGEWRFDEDSGQTAVDAGPHHLNGRLGASGEPDAADPARIAGISGGGLQFDGRSYVRLPDRSELDPQTLTVESVVRASSSPGRWRYLVSRGGRDCFAGSYGLYTGSAGGVAVYVFDGTRYVVGDGPAGGRMGRPLAPRRRHVRRAHRAAIRRRQAGGDHDRHTAADRLRQHDARRLHRAFRG